MKNTITIKEYDCLTSNKSLLQINERFHYLDVNSFKLLEEMVLSANTDEEDDFIDFFSLSVVRNVGKILKAKNYVGIIQLANGQQIEILPKVYGVIQSDPRNLLLKMLQSLRDFNNKTIQSTNLNTSNMTIFEIFIKLYIEEVQTLVKRGLKSAYHTTEGNLRVYKGKLQFSEHLQRNIVHKERFYVQYDEFSINRAENRLIKATLHLLLKRSTSYENVQGIRKVLTYFELIDASMNIEKDFSAVKIDRNSKEYELVMRWSEIFLRNKSFTTFAGNKFGKALLFPMEKLFESYVAKQLKRLLSNDWKINLQDKGHYLFNRQFALRPDIVLTNDDLQKVIIMDTKWKILKNQPRSNYGISQADMYQMYAYAKKYSFDNPTYTHEIWLLYPITDEFVESQIISYESKDDVRVNVLFVDCERMRESLENLIQRLIL